MFGVTGARRVCAGPRAPQAGSCELGRCPPAHLAILLSCPRATEDAEKTTTTYLDNGTHPAQGEVLPGPAPPLGPAPCPPLGLKPVPVGHLTVCVCLSPPPDWAQLDSDSSLFP